MSPVHQRLVVLLSCCCLVATANTLTLTNETAKMLGEIVDEVMRNERLPPSRNTPPVRCIHGTLNKNGTCDCSSNFWTGDSCNSIVCLNGGAVNDALPFFCDCRGTGFVGQHCEIASCQGGRLSPDKLRCNCMGNYFGEQCQFYCWHGSLDINGRCVCEDGTRLLRHF